MHEAGYLRDTVRSTRVSNRDFYHLEVHFCRTEDQVEIAERIKVAKVFPISRQSGVMRFTYHFGAAQCVRETLIEEPREQPREGMVREIIKKSHRIDFHRIDQARSVDEF